jgi:hypothetical protein
LGWKRLHERTTVQFNDISERNNDNNAAESTPVTERQGRVMASNVLERKRKRRKGFAAACGSGQCEQAGRLLGGGQAIPQQFSAQRINSATR